MSEEKGIVKNYLSGILRVALVALLVAFQFLVIILLALWLNAYSVYMYLVIELLSIIIMFALLNDSRSPSYKLVWISVILVLPLSGHIMYALWGKADSKKKLEREVHACLLRGEQFLSYQAEPVKEFTERYPTKSRMVRFLESQHFPLFKNNQVEYCPTGEAAFEAIFRDIREAKRFILINFFIVGEGALWDRMHQLLLEKLQQGVEVKFMYDDFGSAMRTHKEFRHRLEEEGFEIRIFNPIHKYAQKLYMNYRSHQKIVVIDGNIGYTGGMNLADEYVNLVQRFGHWKDNAVRICGEAVWGLTVVFLQMWEVCDRSRQVDYERYRPDAVFEKNRTYCQIVSDGPANNPSNPIEMLYRQIIDYAKDYVYITTPYLVLEESMRDTLILAAKSGIDVRLLTPGIPDKKSVKLLTEYNYGALLAAGVRIFEYTPGFLHAKTIINEDCGMVGTVNMDYRSFYLHYECGAFMCDRAVMQQIRLDLIQTMEASHEITLAEWKNRPLLRKFTQYVLNVFATFM
ncbi:MAG: cardiolipin synthase [Lachnospiraceae bacterium]|nr:cardiolipin synthase [Lachnospiraceae bacterium]